MRLLNQFPFRTVKKGRYIPSLFIKHIFSVFSLFYKPIRENLKKNFHIPDCQNDRGYWYLPGNLVILSTTFHAGEWAVWFP